MGESLHINGWGVFLGKKSERLVIKEKGDVRREIPFFKVDNVTIDSRGVSFSVDALYKLVQEGVQINFITSTGRPYAKIVAPELSATVKTRRQQLLAYKDSRGVQLVKRVVHGKIANQAVLVKYFAKSRKGTAIYEKLQEQIQRIDRVSSEIDRVDGYSIDECRSALMNVEGRAARIYWRCVAQILSDKIDFPGRKHRGASDPVNSALNYGYGILYSRVMGAILLAGLEPYAGFLHVDRPGKPSMVLDLIEEFRQACVDRPIVAAFRKGASVNITDDGLMDEQSRRRVASWVTDRLEARDRYEGGKYTLATILQRQVRHVASFLRKDYEYRPYVASW